MSNACVKKFPGEHDDKTSCARSFLLTEQP